MNYKQKYKEALERAKEMCALPTGKATMEYIFPELKESEDDRIRKDIISYLRNEKNVKRYISDIEFDKWLDWLEKQGEKTHAELGQLAVTKTSDQELDPAKVIAWLVANIIDFEYYVKLFKKDFKL